MTQTVISAIKNYFEDDSDGLGRKVALSELKELSDADRDDFVEMFAAIGVETTRTVAA